MPLGYWRICLSGLFIYYFFVCYYVELMSCNSPVGQAEVDQFAAALIGLPATAVPAASVVVTDDAENLLDEL